MWLRSLTTFADKTQMLHGRLHGNSQCTLLVMCIAAGNAPIKITINRQ